MDVVRTPMTEGTRKRPLSASVVAVVLGWLGAAGILNALIWPSVVGRAELSAFVPRAYGSTTFVALMLVYGVTGLLAARALWRLSPSAPHFYIAWAVAVLLTAVFFLRVEPSAADMSSVALFAPLLLLLVATGLHIRRVVRR
jgi:hypothetical protein